MYPDLFQFPAFFPFVKPIPFSVRAIRQINTSRELTREATVPPRRVCARDNILTGTGGGGKVLSAPASLYHSAVKMSYGPNDPIFPASQPPLLSHPVLLLFRSPVLFLRIQFLFQQPCTRFVPRRNCVLPFSFLSRLHLERVNAGALTLSLCIRCRLLYQRFIAVIAHPEHLSLEM